MAASSPGSKVISVGRVIAETIVDLTERTQAIGDIITSEQIAAILAELIQTAINLGLLFVTPDRFGLMLFSA